MSPPRKQALPGLGWAGLLAMVLLHASACHKKPPVVVPDLEQSSMEQTSDPGIEAAGEPAAETSEETPSFPVDLPDDPGSSVIETPQETADSAKDAPAEPKVKPKPRSPPAEPAAVEAETAKPRLLPDTDTPDRAHLRAMLSTAAELLDRLGRRTLTKRQTDLVVAGEAFVDQAREAFALGDLERTAILIDKALVLLEDVEQGSRP